MLSTRSLKTNMVYLGHQVEEALCHVSVLLDVDNGPLLEVHRHQHVVVGGLSSPVGLGVDGDGDILAQQ